MLSPPSLQIRRGHFTKKSLSHLSWQVTRKSHDI